jgi:hypothetical protein
VSKLRDAARGQACQVRIPSICNFNAETTVLAHYRLSGLNGVGMKPLDICGSWTCSDCHNAIDGRMKVPGTTREDLRLWHAEGVLRTLTLLHKKGLL